MADQEQPIFEVAEDERRHLSNMLKSPGYEVLKKIQRSYVDALRDTAIALSSTDPLGNKDEVLKQWAYIAVAEQFMRQVERGVQFEMAVLHKAEAPPRDPAKMARQRRIHRLSGSLTPLLE